MNDDGNDNHQGLARAFDELLKYLDRRELLSVREIARLRELRQMHGSEGNGTHHLP